ncbi:Retrovirus-related Pol polyprotein from transposon TNT 1-94 [Vitis vinifera]|uniref:Retrovirus-related Pol polyprotein from transposon TNT 1-94 n=1 Tax=Vitis vinifera TaxID=29760 RepID=A0A438J8H9_VITVI|nr:Retrovirus-related Pol polyprotein from transposon TNT 1-94 [Vitis vinifera]
MRYKGKENIKEYIMEMSNLVTRLKALKLKLSEDILVHLVLISLPTQFNSFKISYNTQKEKWTLNELIVQCVQEEERLKQEKIESTHLASTSQGFGANKKRKRDNKGKQTAVYETSKQKVQKKQDKEITCFFCKKWIDTGATTHISVTMQGCLRSRMSIDGKRYIYVGNGNKVAVKAIGLFRLQLDSGFCIECIKGKQTNMRKKDANRCSDVLELIHTEICGPFPTPSWNGQQYFITFIDDYSLYGYLYLIHEKSQSLDVFKNFKAEVENQLSKKIKVVRFDHGGEYYGRYDGSGEQRPGLFAKYLMECGIAPQYTMPGTPSQNGVVERRNRTLKDMVRIPSKAVAKTPYELWTSKKPSIRHLHVWGCPTEARPYKPNEKKLDSRTVSCYFVGYSERSRGFKFYDPSSRSFFETGNAKFIEDVELSGREPLRNVVFEKESVSIPTTGHGHIMFDDTIQNVQSITKIQDTPEIPPAQRRRSTISDDYVVYLQEHEFDMGLEDDPISVSQVKQSSNSKKWIEAMKEEMKLMKDNGVWDLVELPEGVKPIDCKWVFKTKRDSKDNIVRYKARLVAKGFTQKKGIDYKKTFSSVLSNDSFRIIMALVAHYDLELHQMDFKIVFLNGNIDETIYMVQPKNFESNDSKQLVCRLKRSIYDLKQAS